MNVRDVEISTPVQSTTGKKLDDKIALIPIMRAGLGMVDAMLELLPNADVHHIGMYRSKNSLLPVQYYNRLPKECDADIAFVLDPMIATAGTIKAVVSILKKWGVKKVHIVSVLASKTGLESLRAAHPDVFVTVTEVDSVLSEDGMIVPGLGDAGNRLYKTPTIDQVRRLCFAYHHTISFCFALFCFALLCFASRSAFAFSCTPLPNRPF